MRVEWEEHGFDIPHDEIATQFRGIADDFKMRYSLRYSDAVPRMAVFVSKESHCLYDILSRVRSGDALAKKGFLVTPAQDGVSVNPAVLHTPRSPLRAVAGGVLAPVVAPAMVPARAPEL